MTLPSSDPSWPWMIKLARAKQHIDDLARETEQFAKSASSVVSEPGDNAGDIVLRLRVAEPIPLHFAAAAGDAIHNMRSSLDSIAFELARRHCPGVDSDESLQRQCAFPFELTKPGLDRWFRVRERVYGPAERRAIEAVAPGWQWDYLGNDSADPLIGTREEDVQHDLLWTLNRLWNIDKHRRLHVVALWPDNISWATREADEYEWVPGWPPYEDGTEVGRLLARHGAGSFVPHIMSSFELRLIEEDILNQTGLAGAMQMIYGHLTGWVLPQLFRAYDLAVAEAAE
jgi:hypothetical protein